LQSIIAAPKDLPKYLSSDCPEKFGTLKFNSNGVLDKFDANHKAKRLTGPEEFLQILEKCQENSFVPLLTSDESSFFSGYPESGVWAASQDEVAQNSPN
jgi:hypothetical protein